MSAALHPIPRLRTIKDVLDEAHEAYLQRRFSIDIVREDGSTEHIERIGGSACEHAADGMDRGGLGSVVRVRSMEVAA